MADYIMGLYTGYTFGRINRILKLPLESYFNENGEAIPGKLRNNPLNLWKLGKDHYQLFTNKDTLDKLFDAESFFVELNRNWALRQFVGLLSFYGEEAITGIGPGRGDLRDKGMYNMRYILEHVPEKYLNRFFWFHSGEDYVFFSPEEFKKDLIPGVNAILDELMPNNPLLSPDGTALEYEMISEASTDLVKMKLYAHGIRNFCLQAKRFASENEDAFAMIWFR